MTRFQRILALALSLGAMPVLAACGGSGAGAGNIQSPGLGTMTLISINPNLIQGCGPTPFVLTGTNFNSVAGLTARITWRATAPAGATPFLKGTSDRVTTFATVTSDTTIAGITPPVVLCGIPNITVEIDVALESGVSATSAGVFVITINAPVITAINPNPLPAAISTPFQITGTGFGPVGGPVTIRFTGDNNALLFNDGTKNFVDVIGVVTSSTLIDARSPIATVCGTNAVTLAQLGAAIQLFFPDGCCSAQTAPGFVNFTAPVITSLVPNSVPAELNNVAVTLNGANFGPPNTVATVRISGDNNVALFNDGTLNSIDVPGLINGASNAITFISPTATVCGVASLPATIRVIAPYGSSCRQSNAAFMTFTAPVFTTVVPNSVTANIPTQIVINGTGFGPANGLVSVVFISNPTAPPIFNDGTTIESAPVQGQINAAGTTITVTTPHATVLNAAQRFASIRVNFQGGSCQTFGGNAVTFNAATLLSTTVTGPAPTTTFQSTIPTDFTITGINTPGVNQFGPVGSEVFVRFSAPAGSTPFGNGTQNAFEVPGTVTAVNTITATAPLAALCPQTTLAATIRVLFQDGGQSSNTLPVTFNAPTIAFTSATSVNGSIQNAFTIGATGTNQFGPLGSLVAVKFTAPAGTTPFANGTQNEATVTGTVGAGFTITGLTPLAQICGTGATLVASVTATFQGGSCATTATAMTFNGPAAPALVSPATEVELNPVTPIIISGTNLPGLGSPVLVTFSGGVGNVWAAGTASQVTVPGVVSTANTQITIPTPPAAQSCTTFTPVLSIALSPNTPSCVFTLNGPQYLAPAVTTTLTTVTALANAPGLGTSPATIIRFTGTNYPPVGTPTTATFVAPAGTTPFNGGTTSVATITGTVTAANQIDVTAPIVCSTANVAATTFVTFGNVPCQFAGQTFTFNAPTLTALTSAATVAELNPAAPITVSGTNLPPIGTPVQVTFTGGGNAWNGGTSAQTTVAGTVAAGPSISIAAPPIAQACATFTPTMTVSFPTANPAGCTLSIAGPQYIAPAVTTANPTNAAGLGTSPVTNIAFTVTNGPALNTPVLVTFVAPAGTTPFAGGTNSNVVVQGTINPLGTVTVLEPIACATANIVANTTFSFANVPCQFAGPTFTFNAPTLAAPPAVDAIAPSAIAIGGTNLPPNATVEVRFTSTAVRGFKGGSSFSDTAIGTVNAAGTSIAVTPPPQTICLANGNGIDTQVTASVLFPNAACTVTSPLMNYNGPNMTGVAVTGGAPAATDVPFRSTGVITYTMANTANLPISFGSNNVIVRLTSTAGNLIFNDGTTSTVDVVGTVAGNTVTVANRPIATICGLANNQDTVSSRVIYPDGSCVTQPTGNLTFYGPRMTTTSAVAAFQPQNLSYDGNTPFLITALNNTSNPFGPVGTVVNVRFSVAAGTPFRGGTSAFDIVPATVATTTTIVGAAPNVVAAANKVAAVTVQVLYEDGSCTDITAQSTTSYFRADTLLAVGGTGGLTLVSTNAGNPYGTALNTVVAGTPIAGGAAGGQGGVAIDPKLNKAFGISGTNLAVTDLAGPAATSPAGTPSLTGTSVTNVAIGAAGVGMAIDTNAHRVYVLTATAIVVFDGRSNALLLSRTIPPAFAPVASGNTLLNDYARQTLILPTLAGVAGGAFFRYDMTTDAVGGFQVAPAIAGAWNGGSAVGSSAGRVYLAYPAGPATAAIDAATLTTVLWAAGTPVAPSTVMGVDESFNRLVCGTGAATLFAQLAHTGGAAWGPVAIAAPAVSIIGPGPIAQRAYVSAGAVAQVIDTTSGAVLASPAAAGAGALFATSP